MAGLMLPAHRAKLLPIVIVTLLALQGCERAKTKRDREVDRLCAIDGGVHVYETVKLPKENFGDDGTPSVQFRRSISSFGDREKDSLYKSDLSVDLLAERRQIELLRTYMTLKKFRRFVTRLSDGKVLGEVITYSRGGGDFFGPWPGSSYECPKQQVNLIDAIFVKGE